MGENAKLHVVTHVVVENQIALGDPPHGWLARLAGLSAAVGHDATSPPGSARPEAGVDWHGTTVVTRNVGDLNQPASH
jgi:hypothetical protein